MAAVRHFLPWDRPLLPQAVAFLAHGWTGKGPLDLSDVAVIVPTRQSGRRLREALAAAAAQKGKAVFPPRVMLPESLLVSGPDSRGIASRLESQLAWIEVFRSVDLEAYRAVFPIDPPARTFSWARRLAQEFGRLQSTLAEAGLRLADVTGKAGAEFPEAARWTEMAALERQHEERLEALGLKDAQRAKIERAAAPVLPEGIRRVVMLGSPDPLPIAITFLATLAKQVPVDIVVFAPETEQAGFDSWGRPLGAAWENRILDLPDFEKRVQLCADPEEQAERVGAAVRGYRESEGLLAVGIADPEVLPWLENVLAQAGVASFNPEGRPRRGDALYQLLSAVAGLAREESFAAVAALARCPDFLEYLRGKRGAGFSASEFLARLDALHAAHLPPDLREARRHDPGNAELAAVAEFRGPLAAGRFPENAAAALGELFAGRRFELANPADAQAAEAAGAWADLMRAIAAVTDRFADVTNAEWWEFALGLYGEAVRYDEKAAGAVELQGWLELLWEDAPQVAVTGFNDGSVPDAVVGDAFLPESLRAKLGLKTNGARFARDAYLLQAIAACRAGHGRLDLLLGKTSTAGDPLRPSRLLFRCADADLPARVKFLFRPAEAARANPPWQRAWQLVPPAAEPVAKVAVTGLRAWLDCPFRFYLSRVLKLRPVDPAKAELDDLDFGLLCHGALEAMGREPGLRDAVDAAVIRDFLLSALARQAAEQFGPNLTLPLLVQLESARQRLSRAADVQAQSRAEGWVTVGVEQKFEWEVGGLKVTGKIDRIDRHAATGAVRVLDYKTSDKPVHPRDAHLRKAAREERLPEFARFPDLNGREVWKDLQLPVYLRSLAARYPGAVGGYFNLPKASTETGLSMWDDYTREHEASALHCVEGIVAAIRAGQFWPPNEAIRPANDDYAILFHQGAADSVAWPGGGT